MELKRKYMENDEIRRSPKFNELAFELQERINEGVVELGKLSLDLEPAKYIDVLDSWEMDSLKLRQLKRRNNLNLL